jgi:hypothetical protein
MIQCWSYLRNLKRIILDVSKSQVLSPSGTSYQGNGVAPIFYDDHFIEKPPNVYCTEVLKKLRRIVGGNPELAHLKDVEVVFARLKQALAS